MKQIKLFLTQCIPKIHNLPRCIYIKWLDYEWFIPKGD